MEYIFEIWLLGMIASCAVSAWLNRYVEVPDSALVNCALWPVVMVYAAFHVTYSGGIKP